MIIQSEHQVRRVQSTLKAGGVASVSPESNYLQFIEEAVGIPQEIQEHYALIETDMQLLVQRTAEILATNNAGVPVWIANFKMNQSRAFVVRHYRQALLNSPQAVERKLEEVQREMENLPPALYIN